MRTLDRVSAQLRELMRRGPTARYDIARKLAHVEALELFRARDYATVAAYGADVLGVDEDWVTQSIRVADAFSEGVVEIFGFDKLDRALRLIAATPEDDSPDDVPTLMIRVPTPDGLDVVSKPFARATLLDLTRAVALLRHQEGVPSLPARVRRALVRAQRALEEHIAGSEPATASVRPRIDHAGTLRIDIEGLPCQSAASALRAVAAAIAPLHRARRPRRS